MFLYSWSSTVNFLPCQNLLGLQLRDAPVQVGPSNNAPCVLDSCTALTCLILDQGCCLQDADGVHALAAALPRLPALEFLELQLFDNRLPPTLLSSVPQLTSLTLKRQLCAAECLLHLSSLTTLQQLRIDDCMLRGTRPAGLTEGRDGFAVLSPSTAPGLSSLTALTMVDLRADLDPAILVPMTQLRHIYLCDCGIGSEQRASPGDMLAALLSSFAGMPGLQCLWIDGVKLIDAQWPAEPTAYSALSALTALTCLCWDVKTPVSVWHPVFRPGHELPKLQVCIVQGTFQCCNKHCHNVCCMYIHVTPCYIHVTSPTGNMAAVGVAQCELQLVPTVLYRLSSRQLGQLPTE